MKLLLNLRKAGLLAATGTLLLTACKKDKDVVADPPPPPPPAANAKIKKVSKDDHVLEFTYGNDGAVQSVKMTDDVVTGGTPTTFAVSYTADKKISELKAAGGPRFVAHYTGAELSTADLYDESGDLAMTVRYEYLNGTLKSIVGSVGIVDALKFSYAYDAAGNVSRMDVWSFNPITGQLEAGGHTDYTYDGKTNPMHAHKALLYLLLQNTPKNNVTKETEFDKLNAVTETVEYTYQYNNQNLPQSAAVKTTVPGQGSATSTLQYTYQ